MSANDEQPPPKPGSAPHSVDMVVVDLAERKRMGVTKYGTPHQWENGRDHLIDALQESYDMSIYLRAEVEKRKTLRELALKVRADQDEPCADLVTLLDLLEAGHG